ncbi:apolipoprotein L1 isoform X2 [Genypterus blacodes]|uniref:apolipoprotein L1 isoform X2 n=1 Tax=Genypterus blacodes TaxID=154954 RepID=UPI003F76A454
MDRYDSLDLDLDCDEGNVAEKAALFGGMFKKSTRSTETSVLVQEDLSAQSELSKSNDSLSDNNSKEKGNVFKGMFKKSGKPVKEGSAQATLSVPELSASSESLPENDASKEKTGVLGGILKRSPKPGHTRRPSQDLLESPLSASNDSLTDNKNTKETGGFFSGMFKKSHFGARSQSQEDLSAPRELSGSSDNLSETSSTKEKGGIFSGVFKKPKLFGSKSQEDLSGDAALSASSDSLSEKPSKGGITGKILKNPFHSSTQEKEKAETEPIYENVSHPEQHKAKQQKSSDSDGEETFENGKSQPSHKQSKFSEAMTKLNIFRPANQPEKQTDSDEEDPPASKEKPSGPKQKDAEETETLKENEKQGEDKQKPVKSNMIQRERKDRSETPLVPPRPTEEELKRTATYDNVKHGGPDDTQSNKMIPRERARKPADTPVVPARPTEEEMKGTQRSRFRKQKSNYQGQSDDEALKEDESLLTEENRTPNKTAKVKKHKHNPFMPRAGAQAPSDDEGLNEDEPSSVGENKEEEAKDKVEETKVKRPRRHNPFMPRVKVKPGQKRGQEEENEGAKPSLFDQLEELRVDPAERGEDDQNMDGLMQWWDTVESWEDTPQDEDMTEKEEAKAFAVTAEKVQKGIRVFNKLFTERAETLWQHVIDLNAIADGLDKFNKKTKIAQITGGSTSAIGGVATIAGLALAPITMGTSLIITAVGLGVATAGGLTSAGAGISNQVNNSMDRKKVEKIVEDYQEKITDLNKCLKFIKQGIENLHRFDLLRMKSSAYNQDFPALTASFYEDGAMAGKAILINANEIMRVVQIANVAGSTAARAVQIASMATGVLTGLFVGMDIYFVAKDSKELKKGAKSEFAAKIRGVAEQLHDGLVELNGIHQELQSTNTPENNQNTASTDTEKTEEKAESSSEDEIDRIKKAIKKDIENREYV